MSASFQSEPHILMQELPNVAKSPPAFDRDLAAKIGTRIAMRRSLCGLSKPRLAARLGLDSTEVDAYERGEKRMSCELLLEAAKQLKATPRFFFS
jgi:ribosome-binding protein aMBF1 (putative translation factor)